MIFGVFSWLLCGGYVDVLVAHQMAIRDGGEATFLVVREVPVGPQRLGSIRTFSSGSTTLLSGGLSMWVDGVDAMKVTSIVVVAKVVVVSIVIVIGCSSKVVGCCVGP
ncbi:hypothetical protein MtrunA17_Chr3g0122061 [Medicago truncatula]|uniref:Uncharacterized protein n=1 Tax=Medicago truncatula TaxID=3880 RepID=A0A396IXP3_MEDTR|nr:hypothetical protein MtrunA17_Chr3g0122061 [Medicago truncatula]